MPNIRKSKLLRYKFTMALLLTAATLNIVRTPKRVRRFKVRPLNRRRKRFSHFETLYKFMRDNDQDQFFKYTRMTVTQFDTLLMLVKPHLERDPKKLPLSPEERLLITLHFLSEGCSMQQMAWDYFIGKTTVHCVVKETCEVLWNVLKPKVLLPPSQQEWQQIGHDFLTLWNVPNCLGAIDGKHVAIQAPKHSGSDYFSYKKSHSIVLMACCNAKYVFTLVDVGAPGSNHDSFVFKNAGFGDALLRNKLNIPAPKVLPGQTVEMPHFFVADAAFPLSSHIMRPYPGSYLGEKKNICNYRLSRARRVIENSFGILAQRWRILRKPIIADVGNCEKFIKATIVLHNFIMLKEEAAPTRVYCPSGFTDWVDSRGNVNLGQWRNDNTTLPSVGRQGHNNAKQSVKDNRDALADWFVSAVGSVPWQEEKVHAGAAPL